MKRTLPFFIFAVLALHPGLNAQQLPLYSEYTHNNFVLNPAMIGWENITAASLGYRYQWTAMPQSPRTAALSFQHHDEGNSMGYGGYLLHDQTGPTSSTALNFAYAYQLKLNSERIGYDKRQRLHLGLSLSAVQYRLRGGSLLYNDPDDPLIINQTEQRILPDAGFGLMYYNDLYSIGFSVPQLISMNVKFESDNALSAIRRVPHFYVTASAKLKLASKDKNTQHFIVPSMWMKYAPSSPFNVNINVRYWWNYIFTGGLGLATDGTFTADVGLQYRKQYRFGYAFSVPFNELSRQLGTSHELLLTYVFQSNGKGWQFEKVQKPQLTD